MTRNNQITITNPWSGSERTVTRKEIIAEVHRVRTDVDAWGFLHSAAYRQEAADGYSGQDGEISALMYS